MYVLGVPCLFAPLNICLFCVFCVCVLVQILQISFYVFQYIPRYLSAVAYILVAYQRLPSKDCIAQVRQKDGLGDMCSPLVNITKLNCILFCKMKQMPLMVRHQNGVNVNLQYFHPIFGLGSDLFILNHVLGNWEL